LIIRCFITTLSSTLEGTTPRRITIHGNFILIIWPNVAIVVTLVSWIALMNNHSIEFVVMILLLYCDFIQKIVWVEGEAVWKIQGSLEFCP
jgi:hypothetical protein